MSNLDKDSQNNTRFEHPTVYPFKIAFHDGLSQTYYPPRECFLDDDDLLLKDCAHCVYFCEHFYDYPTDNMGVRIIPKEAICPHTQKKCTGSLYVKSTPKLIFLQTDSMPCSTQYSHDEIHRMLEEEKEDYDNPEAYNAKEKLKAKKYRWRVPLTFAIEGEKVLYTPFAGTGYFYYDCEIIHFHHEHDHCVYACKQFDLYRVNSKGYKVIPRDAMCPHTKTPCRGDCLVKEGEFTDHLKDILLETKLSYPVVLPASRIPKACPREKGNTSVECRVCKIQQELSDVELSKAQKQNMESVYRRVCDRCVKEITGRQKG